MTDVLIKRELLERLLYSNSPARFDATEYNAARAELFSILAQPAQQGEAVEVVGMRIRTDGFGSYIADFAMGVPAAMPGEVREPLMTVAQHQRILAASVSAGCKVVPVESLRRWVTGLQLGIISQRSVVEELRAILEAKDE